MTADEIRRWFAIADDRTVSLSDRRAALSELDRGGAGQGSEYNESWICSYIVWAADDRHSRMTPEDQAKYEAEWARLCALVEDEPEIVETARQIPPTGQCDDEPERSAVG